MKKHIRRLLLCTVAVFFNAMLWAQTACDGNALMNYLGKEASSSRLKELKACYRCEMVNEAHYLSKGGVELILQNSRLSEIHIYSKSAVYGTFTGVLPKTLKFGLSSGEVKKRLGHATVSYSSGYCEFEFADYTISCWLDKGKLSQVNLVLKQ